jgi:hypothetical protein
MFKMLVWTSYTTRHLKLVRTRSLTRPCHLRRHSLYVARPGGCRRSALAAARVAVERVVVEQAILRKPKGHDFIIDRAASAPAVHRHMSMTGG